MELIPSENDIDMLVEDRVVSLETTNGTITGKITDSVTGNVVADADIKLFIAATVRLVTSTTSNLNGDYSISALAGVDYRIEYSKTNYETVVFRVILQPDEIKQENIQLDYDGGSIIGTVYRSDTGQVIPSALVKVTIPETGIIIKSTRTNANGNYELSGLPNRDLNFVFSSSGFITQLSNLTITPGKVLIFDATLQPNPATLIGKVIDSETGLPISLALIQTFNNDDLLNATLSDADGNYILHLPGGIYRVLFKKNGYVYQEFSIEAVRGETKIINVSLSKEALPVSGQVVNAESGDPILGALIQIFSVSTGLYIAGSLTDADGDFVINVLPAGTFEIVVSDIGHITQTRIIGPERTGLVFDLVDTIPIIPIVPPIIRNNTYTIIGVLKDKLNCVSICNAVLTVSYLSGDLAAITQSGENGYYELIGIQTGSYILTIKHQFYKTENINVNIYDKSLMINVNMVPINTNLKGKISTCVRKDLSDSKIKLYATCGQLMERTSSDSQGNFVLNKIPSGCNLLVIDFDDKSYKFNIVVDPKDNEQKTFKIK